MGAINPLGPAPLPTLHVPELEPAEVRSGSSEMYVVDARPRAAFASGHVANALGVELADDFGTWVGWLLPFNAPLVLVLDPEQDLAEAVVQLARIGFDRVRGVLRMQRWHAAGFASVTDEVVDVDQFTRAIADGSATQILDVRSPAEWAAGSLPGALWRYVPDLVDSVPPGLDAARPVWLLCASGFRASIAAALLERHGYRPIVLANGGVADVLRQLAAGTVTSPPAT
jgi:rhodanese-related sulfurtransferase